MSDPDGIADAGFDDWLDALAEGEAYFLECADGHGSLPPRRVCPTCGETSLEERPLPETGTLETVTITHVPTPSFEDDAPFALAVADFGPVRLTGQVVGMDLEDVEPGLTVRPDVGVSETTGERLLVFRSQ
ncbi:Zn-ribbon domain-containing OB-fold protein [Natronoglomus mannanivorans]|uniref:Zn-ribbon domain-containing OB-fold protein n=1 Tax=Natronoglomus mannanivorans TaxID=2979990 RepID=A0AAP2YY48_9EURY|nr:Zn-ribbon domain-containing OB-fold protein [Halobacteria archaeon AArc-xg1-1]